MSKPDLSFWLTIDAFTLTEAACLWLDCEPGKKLDPRQEAAASLISEHTGVARGHLYVPDPNGNSSYAPEKLKVTRAELRALAEKRNWQPFFLFGETEKDLKPSERKVLLKMVLGMAIDSYEFNPNSRNKATGEKHGSIAAALEKNGLNVSDDTIRKYLAEASKLLQ